ncbi:class I SAM-dependent methyltransferase [Polluticoccus soli]|uniref:class I SAM-dependent methyltransferase n=1 Tax=Polluticoccus soli TaxID=3034150 RepID=UPI0023E092BC|nr:class I SAM-dependent methyltransferase [Flavipsychrobacter sp. JY13-12]
MKEVKDLFSKQSATYAAYRPTYPDELYDFIFSITQNFDTAWDCGTGNGQAAIRLAEKFRHVIATDLSEKQLSYASQKDNIEYRAARAEDSGLENNSMDLVTVGTALHWFDFDKFYGEVKRVAKPQASIVVWAYAPFRSESAIDEILDNFTYNILGGYWDPERKWVDAQYKTIPFPFKEIPTPELAIKLHWTLDQFMGFLHSWSSVQHYIEKNGNDPVEIIREQLEVLWKSGEVKELRFPLFVRAGIINK